MWDFAENAKNAITMPNIESAGTTHAATEGNTKRHTHTDPLTSPLTTPMAREIPCVLNQWLKNAVIWAFPLPTGAECDSAIC